MCSSSQCYWVESFYCHGKHPREQRWTIAGCHQRCVECLNSLSDGKWQQDDFVLTHLKYYIVWWNFGGFMYRDNGKLQGKANWMYMFYLLSLRTAHSNLLPVGLPHLSEVGCPWAMFACSSVHWFQVAMCFVRLHFQAISSQNFHAIAAHCWQGQNSFQK